MTRFMDRRLGRAAAACALLAACTAGEGLFSDGDPGDDNDGSGGAGNAGGTGSNNTTTTSNTTTGQGGGGLITGSGGNEGGAGPGGGSGEGIPCGTSACSLDNDGACCWDNWQQHGQPQAACVMGTMAADGCATSALGEPVIGGLETRIECQNASDCENGEVCCAQRRDDAFGGHYETVLCSMGNQCNFFSDQRVLCASIGETDGCPMLPGDMGMEQSECADSTLLPPGYNVCRLPP